MGGKGASGRAGARLKSRQRLGRRKALDYVRRLGLRKAARRLDTSVSDLRTWLDRGFPREKLEAAIGLGKVGGAFVAIKGTSLKKLLKKIGKHQIVRLTGLSLKQLIATTKKKPGARITFDRIRFRKLVTKKGAKDTAELLGTKPSAVEGAKRIPLTEVSRRLGKLGKQYGRDNLARYFGISRARLDLWTKNGIPRSWENDVNAALGKRAGINIDEKAITGAPERDVEKIVAAAKKRARKWNAGKSRKKRIGLHDVERWARLGTFNERFAALKDALEATRKPPKPGRRQPPPSAAPPAPLPGRPPGPPPAPPAPPPPPEPPSVTIPEDRKRDFLQARLETFLDGRYPKPPIPWNRIKKWRLSNRNGVHLFKLIQKFAHEIELDKLGTGIIKTARQMWEKFIGDTRRVFMLITITFAVMGDGNPFYPDAFIEGNDVNFITRNIQIYDQQEIEREVRAVMEEIYQVDTESTMLYLEHYEVSKSTPNQRKE